MPTPEGDTVMRWNVGGSITPETTYLVRASNPSVGGRKFIFPHSSEEAAQADMGKLREEGYIDLVIENYPSN